MLCHVKKTTLLLLW